MPDIPAMIVPVLARHELLDRLVRSIDHPVQHLVVIDNGQVMDRAPFSEHVQRSSLVSMPANLGVAGSWNLGIKCAPFAPWWMVVNFDAWFPPGALARLAEEARTDAVVLSAARPPWACFTIGEDAIRKVGLFDERFHPAYFEDNDYAWRCHHHRVDVHHGDIHVEHENSSTLTAGDNRKRNDASFSTNAVTHVFKQQRGDYSTGWDLDKRRLNTWD